MVRKLIALAVISLSLGACDMAAAIKDGITQSEAAAASIEKQVGVKPQVGFSYHNGSFTAATIQFPSIPSASLPEVEKITRKAVLESFKGEPENLVVSFVFKKSGS